MSSLQVTKPDLMLAAGCSMRDLPTPALNYLPISWREFDTVR